MSVASDTLAYFRTEWAKRFVDSCIVKRETSASFSASTGVTTPTYTNQYSGSCLVRPMSATGASFGEQRTEARRYMVFIPYDENEPQVGDLVDVTSTRDGILNGKQLVVRNVGTDSYNTRRILDCEDEQG